MSALLAAATPRPEAGQEASDAWTGFELAGEAFALRAQFVERVLTAGSATALPFAPAGIEGVVSVAGGVLPVVALHALLFPGRSGSAERGSDIVVIRNAGQRFALRVDRVLFIGEHLAGMSPEDGSTPPASSEGVAEWHGRPVTCLAIARLGLEALQPILPPSGAPGMVADTRIEAASAAAAPGDTFVAVNSAGLACGLPATGVTELLSNVAMTPLPLVPRLVLGVAILRGAPLLVLSLARLLGRSESGETAGYVVATVGISRFVLAVDEIIGLRRGDAAGETGANAGETTTKSGIGALHIVDLATAIPADLLTMAASMDRGTAAGRVAARLGERFLTFSLGDRFCAVPLASVDRIHGPRPPIRLPAGMPPGIHGAVEVGGRVVPLTEGRQWLALPEAERPPAAHVVLQHNGERRVLAVDAVHRVVTIAEQDILSTGDADQPIAAVGRTGGRSIAILSAAQLMSAGAVA